MKKLFGIFVLSMIFVSMGAVMVSAASEPVEAINNVLKGIYEFVKPALVTILGDSGTNGLFLAKIMFMIVVFAVLWKILDRIPFFQETPWVLWIVSIAVSILSTGIFNRTDVIESILLPYSALGIVITACLPFLLFFFIVKDFEVTIARKIAWVAFMVVFVTLGIVRKDVAEYSYIYLITAGASLLVLAFDGTIQKILAKMNMEKGDVVRKSKQVSHWKTELDRIEIDYKRDSTTYTSAYFPRTAKGRKSYDKDMDHINKQILALKI